MTNPDPCHWIVTYDDGTELDELEACDHEAAVVVSGTSHVWACVELSRVHWVRLPEAGLLVDCRPEGREPVFFRRRVIPDAMNSGAVDDALGWAGVGYQEAGIEVLAAVDANGIVVVGAVR